MLLANAGSGVFSFAEDADGELYVVGRHAIKKIVAPNVLFKSVLPARLSDTGCFDVDDPMVAAPGLIPYDVNSPLWSDGAEKRRWFAMADWDRSDTRIEIQDNGDWNFPEGSVLVKSFALEGVMLETRFLVRNLDGDWIGYSYKWDDTQTDATLADKEGEIINVLGKEWSVPSRTECFVCHTDTAGISLGLETGQLNRDFNYQSSGVEANQIFTLFHIDMLADQPHFTRKLPDPLDPDSGSLEERAKSYLHANCAMCHLPDGDGQGRMDFRYQTELEFANIINEPPSQNGLGLEDSRIVVPGSPERSVLVHRIGVRGDNQMPPLGTALVDPCLLYTSPSPRD